MGHYLSPGFLNRHGSLDPERIGNTYAGIFAKATAIGGLPVPVAEIALPRAATRCFPDLVSRDSNGLVLISFRLARACARGRGLAWRQRLSR
jgi:hypothetical protein